MIWLILGYVIIGLSVAGSVHRYLLDDDEDPSAYLFSGLLGVMWILFLPIFLVGWVGSKWLTVLFGEK